MKAEIDAAIQFILSLLSRAKIPKDSQSIFRITLEDGMKQRFSSIWDPSNPQRGNAYRSIFTDGQIDPLIQQAALKASINQIGAYLPDDFVIWVDPGSVSYRIGEHGNTLKVYDAANVEGKRKPAYTAVKSQKVTIKQPPKKSHSSREPVASPSLSAVSVRT